MKKGIQAILQRLLGFDHYLFIFSLFKIRTIKWDRKDKEGDFNFFLRLLQADDQILDIGANVGIMTVLMAKRCRRGKVFAFEPVPENFRALERIVTFMRLKNVELFQIALGEEKGEVEMRMPVLQGVKMQGLSHISHDSIKGYETVNIDYRVSLQRLDDLPYLTGEHISAIKMDVENYEQFVLRGGKKLLSKHMPLIYCELWDNENRQACFSFLQNLGYEIKVLENKKLVEFLPDSHPNHNFFFLPPNWGLNSSIRANFLA